MEPLKIGISARLLYPDPRRILMADDWDGFPQRKDYPLGYETVQFSFNFDEVNKFKPFAKE